MYVQIASSLRVENYDRIPRFRFAVFTWHPSSVSFIYQVKCGFNPFVHIEKINCSLQGRDHVFVTVTMVPTEDSTWMSRAINAID